MPPDGIPDFRYVPPRPHMVWAFAHYFRRLFRRQFSAVRWLALDEPARWARETPTLVVANHTNWWDGFLAFLLTFEFGRTCHILMQADQLARYGAFRTIGVLPMRRGSLKGAWEDLRHAGRHLRPDTALWIFPQGQRRPAGEPLAALERGVAQLVNEAGRDVRIVPVAFRYPFLSEQLPEAYALVGTPWTEAPSRDRRATADRIGTGLAATVAQLDARLAAEEVGPFRTLVPGRLSINKRMDRVRHALGLLEGPFETRNG